MPKNVLVVDDSMLMRKMVADTLVDAGWQVIGEATNGQEAVDLFKARQNDVELVIMDVVMPVMNGRLAVKALRSIRGDLKVLFISGCSDSSQIEKLHEEGFHLFLAKPFSVFQMQNLVEEILGSSNA